jgi:hypothetical protein
MTDEEWRAGILRRMDNLEAGQSKLEARMATVETQSAVDEVHRVNVENRLTGIEDSLKWLVRLILGALVLGALAFALGGGMSLPGS